MGRPKYDPHGDPIPNAEGRFTLRDQKALSRCNVHQLYVLVGVRNHQTEFLQHLNRLGLALGTTVKIIDKSSFDRSMKIIINGDLQETISDATAQNLLTSIAK